MRVMSAKYDVSGRLIERRDRDLATSQSVRSAMLGCYKTSLESKMPNSALSTFTMHKAGSSLIAGPERSSFFRGSLVEPWAPISARRIL